MLKSLVALMLVFVVAKAKALTQKETKWIRRKSQATREMGKRAMEMMPLSAHPSMLPIHYGTVKQDIAPLPRSKRHFLETRRLNSQKSKAPEIPDSPKDESSDSDSEQRLTCRSPLFKKRLREC